MMSLVDFVSQVLDFVVESLVFFLKVEDSGFNRCAFSSFVLELSFDFVELLFLKIAVSSHLFDDSFELLAFSFKFFGVFLILLDFALLGLGLLSESLIFLFHLS